MKGLGKRLGAALKFIDCDTLADVGCDHGKAGIAAIRTGRAKRVIMTDISKKSLSKGVHITVVEDSVSVEVSILIQYGFTIPAVAGAVQEAVFNAISNTSGLDVTCVNVNVAGVAFDREEKKA